MSSASACSRAEALFRARLTRQPIAPFTDTDPDLGMADGYEIQQELVKLLVQSGDRVIGHKVGATSVAMQRLIGIDSPDYGPVLSSTLYHHGDSVALGDFIAPKIEAEIAFVLGSPLEGPNVSYVQARNAIATMAASMEIVDSRIADWRIQLADTVADLASNGALVVSSNYVPAEGIDAASIGLVLKRNGEIIAKGIGADALGDPVTVLVWLANVLGRNGVALEPGHIVLTGALHAAVSMAPGDVFRAEFDHLGAVEIDVTA